SYDAAARDLRFALVGVRVRVRSENVRQPRRVERGAEFAAARDAAFGVEITAARIEIIASPRSRLRQQTIADRSLELCIKINGGKFRVPRREIFIGADIECSRTLRLQVRVADRHKTIGWKRAVKCSEPFIKRRHAITRSGVRPKLYAEPRNEVRRGTIERHGVRRIRGRNVRIRRVRQAEIRRAQSKKLCTNTTRELQLSVEQTYQILSVQRL